MVDMSFMQRRFSLLAPVTIFFILFRSVAFADAALPAVPDKVERTAKIDFLMGSAIARGLIAGGVVLVGNRKGVLFERAYGKSSAEPNAPLMDIDTIFDIASLTKVVATAPAILKLAEEKKLSLVDPVAKWFPEFAGKSKDDLRVLNLLTHTSGLDDFPFAPSNPLHSAVEGAANQKLKGEIGSRFRYADINFILLGEMVRRVTGTALDQYAAAYFFTPLGMNDTTFNPGPDKVSRCSATVSEENKTLLGLVQDPVSRQLGGVAGHAGVFSSGRDLARFCRMVLNDGEFEGRRILSARAVQQMTAPYFSRGGSVIRGLGWDISSPFSSPKGNGFSEASFGHTGYSGSSIWLDPSADIFVVLLTARLNYKNTKEFNQLRSDLSSFSAEIFSSAAEKSNLAHNNLQER
jgi:CubicO group peptidase (beta-lactamase class C family)